MNLQSVLSGKYELARSRLSEDTRKLISYGGGGVIIAGTTILLGFFIEWFSTFIPQPFSGMIRVGSYLCAAFIAFFLLFGASLVLGLIYAGCETVAALVRNARST